ncbi:MAG TPA: hypothetical protein VMF32_11300 [Xanthobacteraceae bacterium]|nr:hypothetical protein [Xanthobacteraceae bacterium]
MNRTVQLLATTLCLAITVQATATPAFAISLELARKCRAMALQAHPYKLPGEPGPGSAAAERGYYDECVANGGNMPENNSSATPGGKTGQSPTVPPQGNSQPPTPAK